MVMPRHLLVALLGCVVLYFANLSARRLQPQFSAITGTATDSFTAGSGWYPGEPLEHAKNLQLWGSWSGGDERTGTLTIGPFPAPKTLHFVIGGYLPTAGNTLHLERVDSGERARIEYGPVGERWAICDFDPPSGWEGKPVRLVAVDNATTLGGWFAISEPLRGGRSDGNNALLESLTAWSINGLLLGLAYVGAARALINRAQVSSHWIPLAAGAIVALCGYISYWAFLIHPWLGWTTSIGVLVVGLSQVVRRGRRGRWSATRTAHAAAAHAPAGAATLRADADDSAAATDLGTVIALMLGIGAFYLAVLHLFPTAHDFYTLTANRFRESLPGDNSLSHMYAERLFAGESPKNPADGWQSSDRPPLQIGWQLLTWPVSKLLQLDRRTASGTSAVWFQLLWVAGAYALLRTFKLTPRRAAAWVAVAGLAGFYLQNTTFTWPKLSAGAFACGTFAFLFLPLTPDNLRTRGVWAALFGGLAWLSHGGVAFSFLPLVPWVIWRALRGAWRPWLAGAAVFATLALPWIAYQKFYDPPGNMLLKLHFAGQENQDARSLTTTLRDSYAQIGWRKAVANRVSNLHSQILGDWRQLLDVRAATKVERRNREFFHPLRGLTWWPVLALIAVALTGRRVLTEPRELGLLVGWVLATIVVWCLLMFGTYSASIHHGSYAVMIVGFVVFSLLLERSGSVWLLILAALQAVTLSTTWMVSNAAIFGEPAGLPIVIVTAAILAGFIIRGYRNREPTSASRPATTSTAPPSQASTSPDGAMRFTERLRAWGENPRLNAWVLLGLAVLCFIRKPDAFHTPQLWAEDGAIFLIQNDHHGLGALAMPYAGYLHVLPRLIAWLAAKTFDPQWWPAFYNGAAILLWVGVMARFFSPRIVVPGRLWVAIAVVAVPHSGEVFFNITNLQWLTALVLVQQAIIAAPRTTAERITDLLIIAVVALTGPFGIALFPLFLWRWWRHRDRDATILLMVLACCVAVQAWFILRTSQRFEFQALPLKIWPNVVIAARRLIVAPVLGHEIALSLSPVLIGGVGGTVLLAVFAWALRPHPWRELRAQTIVALALVLLAGLYRTRPDTWAADNLDFGDRYFFIPRVLLGWLLIWEFHAVPRAIAIVARLICVVSLLFRAHDFVLPAPKDYEWRKHVEPIRQGLPVVIPTLPEGWSLDYPGRPPAK